VPAAANAPEAEVVAPPMNDVPSSLIDLPVAFVPLVKNVPGATHDAVDDADDVIVAARVLPVGLTAIVSAFTTSISTTWVSAIAQVVDEHPTT